MERIKLAFDTEATPVYSTLVWTNICEATPVWILLLSSGIRQTVKRRASQVLSTHFIIIIIIMAWLVLE